jgi:hypothetical protein
MTVAIDEDWAENYPVEYGIMMDCWEESIEVAVETPARAAPYLVQGGLIAAESDAAALVGRSGLAWLQGADAQAAVMAYLDAVYALDPALTGGSMPGDVFYFGT